MRLARSAGDRQDLRAGWSGGGRSACVEGGRDDGGTVVKGGG